MIFEREDDRNRRPLWIFIIPDSLKKRLEDILYSNLTREKIRKPKSSKPSFSNAARSSSESFFLCF